MTHIPTRKKKLLLLGANGRTGRKVLAGALAEGHSVTAVVRAVSKLPDVRHENLVVAEGSACDEGFLERLMPGHDAVISTLGPRWPTASAAAIYPRSGAAIVAAMWSSGVNRLLVTSSALLFPDDRPVTRAVRWLVPAIVSGAGEMERHITGSNVDWTIVRTTFLNNASDPAHHVGAHPRRGGAVAVSRTAVAQFLLDELGACRFSREVVGLWG